MKAILAALGALFLATAVLNIANGSLFTLIGLKLADAVDASLVGLVASGHFVGLLAGSLTATLIVVRVGHIRAFAVFAAVAACTVIFMGLVFSVPTWFVARMVVGYCMAGLFVVLESWFNDRATNATRGRIFSLYMVASSGAFAVGPFLVNIGDYTSYRLFAVTAILFNLCLLPIALTRSTNPTISIGKRMKLSTLFGISPLGFLGCLAAGFVQSAVYGMAAVYGALVGLDAGGVATMFSAIVFGGLLMQFPVGWMSDHFDRRKMLLAMACLASCVALAIVFLGEAYPALLFPLCFLYGATTSPIYGLAVAQTNDYVERDRFVAASGGLLVIYALGAIAGPNVASWLMDLGGARGLWIYAAAVLALLALLTVFRMSRRAPLPVTDQGTYVPPAGESSLARELDPRAPALDEDREVPAASDDAPRTT